MALNFPASPVEGQIYNASGKTYAYRTNRWVVVGTGTGLFTTEIISDAVEGTDKGGWQVVGDMLFQWGDDKSVGTNTRTITLPVAYPNTEYVISVSSGSTGNRLVAWNTQTVTGFDIYGFVADTGSANAVDGSWMTMGEAPDSLKLSKTVVGGSGDLTPTTIAESDTATGWQITGDMLVCWGQANQGTHPTTYTYPKAFKTGTSPSVSTVSDINAGANPVITTMNGTPGTASFGLYCNTQSGATATGQTVNWIAYGEALDADKMPKEVEVVESSTTTREIVSANVAEGYQIWGDTMIQWGTYSTIGTGLTASVFPIAFETAPKVTLTPEAGAASVGASIGTASITTTQFTCASFNTGTGAFLTANVNWVAIGEAPDNLKLTKTVQTGTGDVAPTTIVEANVVAGWQVMGDTLLCWGVGTTGTGGYVETFPTPFKTGTVPVVTANSTGAEASGTQTRAVICDLIGAADFTIRHRYVNTPFGIGSASQNVTWMAIGEAPDAIKQPKVVQTAGGTDLMEFHDPAGALSWRIVGRTLEAWGNAVDGAIVFPKTFARAPELTLTPNAQTAQAANVTYGCYYETLSTTGANIRIRSLVGAAGPAATGRPITWHAIGEWDGLS